MSNKENKFKTTCKKISSVCKLIFGYGVMITLFLGGLTFIGYLLALIIGGDTASAICNFLYKEFFPILIYITSCLVLFGLLAMYLAGEKSLTPTKRKIPEKKVQQPQEQPAQPTEPKKEENCEQKEQN
ncbi:MAG: hypothetical protein II988_00885 [Clostridia bacterium]|nr:hypothetical protein [Clostridia bacterium]